MEQKSTLEQALTELLTPIIEKALARHQVFMDTPAESQSTTDEIFDVEGLSTYLKLTKSGIYALTSQRRIVHYKRGKRLYFYKKDVDAYIQEGRVKTMEEIEREANNYIIRKRK